MFEDSYEKWPNEELIITAETNEQLMVQWKQHPEYERMLTFRVARWCGSSGGKGDWEEGGATDIETVLRGDITYDGIRHCYFGDSRNLNDEDEGYNGYLHYIDLQGMSACLLKLHEICLRHCLCYP